MLVSDPGSAIYYNSSVTLASHFSKRLLLNLVICKHNNSTYIKVVKSQQVRNEYA